MSLPMGTIQVDAGELLVAALVVDVVEEAFGADVVVAAG